MEQMYLKKHKPKAINLTLCLFVYWFVLVVWQNFLPYDKDSNFSIAVKVGLLLYLCINFLREGAKINLTRFVIWSFFALYAMTSLMLSGDNILGGNLVFYLFPVIFTFLTLVIRSDYQVNRKQYLLFLHLVIAVVFYMALYSLIFQWYHFAYFFHLNKAYGFELASFLISNHEYGMYLVFGITSLVLCYQNTERTILKVLYVLLLIVFGANLVLTLSRTSYLACLVIIFVFVLTSKSVGTKKWFILAVLGFALATFLIPGGTEFVEKIMLKENDDAGRIDMWTASFDKYHSGSILQQLFGFGNKEIAEFTSGTFRHGSVHNAYLQTLLTWGAFGVAFLIGANLCSLFNAIRLFYHDRNMAAVFLALFFSQIAFMFTNTACLFQSVIDSFMLTVFSFVVPKYVINSIVGESYESKDLPAAESSAKTERAV